MRPPTLCPVHGYARQYCSSRCAPARKEYRRLATQLRTYWWERKRGVRPLRRDIYLARFWPDDA